MQLTTSEAAAAPTHPPDRSVLAKLHDNVELFGLARTLRWLYRYGLWHLHRRVLESRYREIAVYDFRLVVDLHDLGIAKELMIIGSREEEHRYLLRQFLRPGMTVLDCGANIGYYSVMMAKLVGPTGRIYAVEPDPFNYHLVNINARLNGLEHVIETFNLGLSNKTGVETFHKSVMSNRHTFHPREYSGAGTQTLSGEAIDVHVTTVGAFAAGRRPIDLIRMDIEGYEVEVFDGLMAALEEGLPAPAILFETHRSRYDRASHDMTAPLSRLFAFGYRPACLVSDGHDRRGGRRAFADRGYDATRIEAVFPSCDRAVYRDVAPTDAVELICDTDWVRAALLRPPA